jgi:heat shock protein HslJ
MDDLERSVRETLAARVSHLTDERLAADLAAPQPTQRRSARSFLLPLAAAAAVAAIAIGVAVAVSSSRHAHAPATPPPSLAGTPWQLESLTQHGRTLQTPADVTAIMVFDREGSVSGNTGCNAFGGTVRIGPDTIKVGRLTQTAMGCLGNRGTTEAVFDDVLRAVDHWSVKDGTLLLTGPGGSAMRFTRAAAPPTQAPEPTLQVLEQGRHNGGNYTLGYVRSTGVIGVSFDWTEGQESSGAGNSFSSGTPGQPPLATACARTAGQSQFVFGWSQVKAITVKYVAGGAAPVTLRPHSLPGSPALTVFGGFVEHPAANATVIAYGQTGAEVARESHVSCG